jgi:hypothetical protein
MTNGNVILKQKYAVRVWTGFTWLRVGSYCGKYSIFHNHVNK